MITLWITIFFVTFILLAKLIYNKLFNPIFLYVGVWSFTIYLYSLKLIDYSDISNFTWGIVISVFLAFLSGVIVNRLLWNNSIKTLEYDEIWWLSKETNIKKIILYSSLVGFFVSIQHWYVLVKEFGSISMVLLNASQIYDMRVEGEHLGKIPYLNLFSYVGVFFSGIHSALRNKFSYLVIFPLIAVILTDAASLARAGVFFAFVLFSITFITNRYFFKSITKRDVYTKNTNIFITTFLIIFIAIGSVSLIRLIRNPLGDFKSTSIELKKLSNSGIISSSIYLYFSSPIAVLNEYLDKRKEVAVFGENTFYPIYNNLNRIGAKVNLKPYPKGYFIPMWVNSATYIRELDVDFGPSGIFIFPFILGFLSTYFWKKFFDTGNIVYIVFYSFTTTLIVFSIFYIGTRLTFWLFGFLFTLIVTYFLKKGKKTSQNT